MTAVPVLPLLVIAFLILVLGGLLSAAEAALTSATRAAAQDLVDEERRGAQRVLALVEARDQVLIGLSAARLGVDMLAAVSLTIALSGFFDDWWAVLTAALLINGVLIGLVTGLSPRSAARANPSSYLLALAGLIELVDRLTRPWQWLESRLSRRETPVAASVELSEDFREMIDEIGEADSIEEEDREMLRSVVELGHTRVREVMVPRTDMVTLDAGQSVSEAMHLFIQSGYSRMPVIGEDGDDVRGVVYLKDLLRRLDAQPEFAIREVEACMREASFIPETVLADDLLREMQADSVHMALAVDEYGGTAGLVTMEDLLEEVVGELTDEHDHAEREVEELSPGLYRIPARLGLDELGELFDLEIEDDDVDTAGGLLAKAIGRVPLAGDEGWAQGVRLVAGEVTGRRRQVSTILAEAAPEEPAAPAPSSSSGETLPTASDN